MTALTALRDEADARLYVALLRASASWRADSLNTVEILMAIETQFGIEIPDDAASTILTFGDIVRYLKGRGL